MGDSSNVVIGNILGSNIANIALVIGFCVLFYKLIFESDILKLAQSSNLAISRCGASTTAELVHTFTPFIAVPLPNSIDNHQYLNAKYYEDAGCCWLLEQSNFNAKNLFDLIIKNIKDKKRLENIQNNMKKNSNKNVYINIENQIKDFI